MANTFIKPDDIAKELLHLISRTVKGVKAQRALWYDLQTSFGGFPASKKQRDKFIKTGKY